MAGTRLTGILLTGGLSRRMGKDKATLVVGGMTLARRSARLLAGAADPVIEVGPGHSGLSFLVEEPPGQGPLVAIAGARRHLRQEGWTGPALVLACDLPRLEAQVLEVLAHWPGSGTILPTLGGRDQPLCARWSAEDLDRAVARAEAGERSLRWLSDSNPIRLAETDWPEPALAASLADADTPEDLEKLSPPRPE
ncbi:MAG: molybdenum cofactor guanylyltransferase [Acidimicrobiales bacterium]